MFEAIILVIDYICKMFTAVLLVIYGFIFQLDTSVNTNLEKFKATTRDVEDIKEQVIDKANLAKIQRESLNKLKDDAIKYFSKSTKTRSMMETFIDERSVDITLLKNNRNNKNGISKEKELALLKIQVASEVLINDIISGNDNIIKNWNKLKESEKSEIERARLIETELLKILKKHEIDSTSKDGIKIKTNLGE